MTRDAAFKSRVRDRMRKTGERYATARARIDTNAAAQASLDTESGVLHLTNGDSTVEVLRATGLTGPILPWRDVLHDGPVPGGVSDAELRRIRADFLCSDGSRDPEAVRRGFEERDRLLEEYVNGEVVLWFEADLYDQLQIIQVLDQVRRLGMDPGRISLVSAGEFPGIAHFGGLGQLAPADLVRLREDEILLTQDDLDTASVAWAAFTATDPSGLEDVARASSRVLRYLGESFGRLMQEYPAMSDGLALTQRRILLAVEDGIGVAGEVFAELGRRERRPYLGDTCCWATMAGLAAARQPLLALGDGEPFRTRSIALTEPGRAVLAGELDHLSANGIDRWIGGVHLSDARTSWRYDARRETLVQPG